MSAPIDVRRLIRIATFLLCIVTVSVVYFSFAPQIDAVTLRGDQAQTQLRSDESTYSELSILRREKVVLARRYARLFAQNPEAVFLGGLAADIARHGLTLVSTTEIHDSAGQMSSPSAASGPIVATGSKTQLTVEMRGSYRHLLAAIGELSMGDEIVRVDAPTLRRDGPEVTAVIPVTIFEPTAHVPQTVLTP